MLSVQLADNPLTLRGFDSNRHHQEDVVGSKLSEPYTLAHVSCVLCEVRRSHHSYEALQPSLRTEAFTLLTGACVARSTDTLALSQAVLNAMVNTVPRARRTASKIELFEPHRWIHNCVYIVYCILYAKCLSVCLLVCLFVCLLVCLFLCLFVCLFVYILLCMYVCLFVCLPLLCLLIHQIIDIKDCYREHSV